MSVDDEWNMYMNNNDDESNVELVSKLVLDKKQPECED